MGTVVLVTQARLNSSRFPKKILEEINGKSLIEIHLDRLLNSKFSENLIVATTHEDGIEDLLKLLKKKEISYYQGSVNDVLSRIYFASKKINPQFIVRVTSDCPLIDSKLIDQIIEYALKNNFDYVSNTLKENYPDGQDIEVIKWNALEYAFKFAVDNYDREHVTPYIIRNSTFHGKFLFKSANFYCSNNYKHIRMTVDEVLDLDAIKILISNLGFKKSWIDYTEFILQNRDIFKNQKIKRNAGSKK